LKTRFQLGLPNVEVFLQKKDCLRGGGLDGCQWFNLKDVLRGFHMYLSSDNYMPRISLARIARPHSDAFG